MAIPIMLRKFLISGPLPGIHRPEIPTGSWWLLEVLTRPLPLRSLSKTIIFFLFLSGCSQSFLPSSRQLLPEIEPVFSLTKSRFDQIPGWGEGQEKQALKAFLTKNHVFSFLRHVYLAGFFFRISDIFFLSASEKKSQRELYLDDFQK